MRHDRACAVSLSIVEVTPTTQWIFVEVATEAGLRGVGEATLPGREAAVADAVAALAPTMLALPTIDPAGLTRRTPAGLPDAAALSALDQACWDLTAQHRGVRLADALGPVKRERVPVYANVNRRTRDRSPAAFAASARAAIAAGHDAIKLAPFDEATTTTCRDDAVASLLPGLARVAAVRAAVGADAGLMIDCHWRLDPAAADYAIAAAADLGVTWIECPLPETPDNIAAIVRLRGTANRYGMTLAGMESAIGLTGFLPFIDARAYDVMMPDIKYVGGLAEVMRLSERLHAAGIGFSPHNPSGPVCHAISLHVCAAVERIHSLETQFDETPLFAALAGSNLVGAHSGAIAVPAGPGAGITLQHAALTDHRATRWTADRTAA